MNLFTADDIAGAVRFDADERRRMRQQDRRVIVRLALFHGERLAQGAFFRDPALSAAVGRALELRHLARRSAAGAVPR